MGRAANHRVEVGLLYVKVDVEAVQDADVRLAEELVDHLDVVVSIFDVLGSIGADLNPG